jgi:hypothetical protein
MGARRSLISRRKIMSVLETFHNLKRDRHLDALRHEIGQLQRAAGQVGGTLIGDASDLGAALSHGGKAVARTLGRGARAMGKDPVPVLAFAVAAGCLASLILSRK